MIKTFFKREHEKKEIFLPFLNSSDKPYALLTQDVIWTSFQRLLDVMDVKTTLCAYWMFSEQISGHQRILQRSRIHIRPNS